MISKIYQEDVFRPEQANEHGRKIIVGTGTSGINTEGVAKHIANYLHSDFENLGSANLGDVHTRYGDNGDTYHGVVVNSKDINNNSNWKNSDKYLAQGLQDIYKSSSEKNENDEYENPFSITLKPILTRAEIIKVLLDTENQAAKILDPHRIVFIGSGESGMRGRSETAKILGVMQESNLDLHLYLYNRKVSAHVAEVIKLHKGLELSDTADGLRLAA